MQTPYGFRIVGPTHGSRQLIEWAAAAAAYAACDDRAQVHQEGYLSDFTFDEAIRNRADTFGLLNLRDYEGVCGSHHVSFDIDRASALADALLDARRLATHVNQKYSLAPDELLVFFSGAKGFHIGLPTAFWSPEPSDIYHHTTRRFAEALAAEAGVVIDTSIYDRVRAFRAPNSRHPKTNLYKRRLTADEWSNLAIEQVLELAREPQPFALPVVTRTSSVAAADWQAAQEAVNTRAAEPAPLRADGSALLFARTRHFIREGAPEGERAHRLFAAAANLAECGCPTSLVEQLLTEPARDSGLTPSETARTIRNGVARGRRNRE
jgi:hypothetical protein